VSDSTPAPASDSTPAPVPVPDGTPAAVFDSAPLSVRGGILVRTRSITLRNAPPDAAPIVGMPVLEACGLVKRYDKHDAVVGVDLTIGAREEVALVGPSGCGKTTLLHMLGLLEHPTAGTVLFDGVDAFALPASERAAARLAHVGFVFQQHNLFPDMTALENIALPAWRKLGSRLEAYAAARELLARFDLEARADSRARELSVGEAQRVAIARALVNRPRLVLADEPTGSLDSRSTDTVMRALEEVRARGAALLVVTHDAAVATRASRILRMADGALVGESLLSAPAEAATTPE
jgi:lipoprotein-releasing system ATP-binding protein